MEEIYDFPGPEAIVDSASRTAGDRCWRIVDELAHVCEGKDRDELIWPSPRGGYISGPLLWKTSWLAMAVARCQRADPTFPRVTPHDLRHTAVSLAISAGANPKVVQRMLGHASAAITLDIYADLFESDLDAVAVRPRKRLYQCI